MKRPKSNLLSLCLGIGATLLFANQSQSMTYSEPNLDCMLCFRQLGTANPYDLEVNLGSVTNFYGVGIGNTINITNYTVAQLSNAVAGANFASVEFSLCVGNYSHSAGNSLNYPRGTLWVTLPRTDVNSQSSPFQRTTVTLQVACCSDINELGGQASLYSGNNSPDPLANTATAVAIPPLSSFSCENYVGPGAPSMLNNTISVNIGQYAPSPFTQLLRSDFYVDYPKGSPDPLNGNATSGNVSLIGYFTFNTNGTMTFTRQAATPALPPQPTLSVTQTNGTNFISFPSTGGVIYTLLYTNSAGLGALRSSWAAAAGTITGDGTVKVFTDEPAPATMRLYSVSAHN